MLPKKHRYFLIMSVKNEMLDREFTNSEKKIINLARNNVTY